LTVILQHRGPLERINGLAKATMGPSSGKFDIQPGYWGSKMFTRNLFVRVVGTASFRTGSDGLRRNVPSALGGEETLAAPPTIN
jgi:hypothetical protein